MKSLGISRSSIAIWLLGGIVAALSCSLYFDAAHYRGEYLPVGNDSFYHARRILDTVKDPAAFYEFDARIHAPEGSLLCWPWGYDYVMAQIVRLGLALGLSDDPMAILIWIPVAAVFISMALLITVARRLGMSTWPTALAAACMALAPTTQFLHGTGQIDHHYAEMIMILAMLASGLKWFREEDDAVAAGVLGAVLGMAPAIHNGMFILQLPILATMFARWLQGTRAPRRSATVFVAVLLATTTAVLLPSTSFRELRFEFFTLSWFHLYIAVCTALAAVFMATLQRSPRTLAVLATGGLILLLPIASQIQMAQAFVSGTMKWLESIAEMTSPIAEALTPSGARGITGVYSGLIWIAPLTLVMSLVQGWRERSSNRLLFWISCAGGLALLSTQLRMHYFGDFALYLPWLVLASDMAQRAPHLQKKIFLATSLALLLLYTPTLRYQLVAPVPRANDRSFENTRSMYSVLQKACAEDPGIVLADNNAGHYIRYYTECSVMVDNFLLTPLHFRKMDEVQALFAGGAAQLPKSAPQVKYVLVRPVEIRRADDPKQGYDYWFFFPGQRQLVADLLLGPVENVPPQYQLLDEIRFPQADNVPYARLFKIRHEGDTNSVATTPSSNDGSK